MWTIHSFIVLFLFHSFRFSPILSFCITHFLLVPTNILIHPSDWILIQYPWFYPLFVFLHWKFWLSLFAFIIYNILSLMLFYHRLHNPIAFTAHSKIEDSVAKQLFKYSWHVSFFAPNFSMSKCIKGIHIPTPFSFFELFFFINQYEFSPNPNTIQSSTNHFPSAQCSFILRTSWFRIGSSCTPSPFFPIVSCSAANPATKLTAANTNNNARILSGSSSIEIIRWRLPCSFPFLDYRWLHSFRLGFCFLYKQNTIFLSYWFNFCKI